MAKGGYRPGAGRKKGAASIASEAMRAAIAEKVLAEADAIVGPQIEKAKKGDTQAFKEIMNRAFGMPRQNVGLDGGDEGEPIVFKDVSKMTPEEIDEYLREKLTGGSS